MLETLTGDYEIRQRPKTLAYFFLVACAYTMIFVAITVVSVNGQRATLASSNSRILVKLLPPLPRPHSSQPPGKAAKNGGLAALTSQPVRLSKADRLPLISIPFLPPDGRTQVLPASASVWIPGAPAGYQGSGEPGHGSDQAGLVARPPSPPAAHAAKAEPVRLTSEMILGKVVHRETPEYPDFVRRMGIYGVVQVEITVDEHGRVTDAQAISGPPLLFAVSVRAVKAWTFSPTILNKKPIAVSGVVTFNFVLR